MDNKIIIDYMYNIHTRVKNTGGRISYLFLRFSGHMLSRDKEPKKCDPSRTMFDNFRRRQLRLRKYDIRLSNVSLLTHTGDAI